MFSRMLIANRGEIACRIIRTCKRLGIETVAVYSEVDRDSLHVRMADVAICIGPAESGRSYLHIPSLISAAEIADVDAIHPGYGFLAENGHFADICGSLDIRFVGPSSDAMNRMGNKAEARKLAKTAGVPVLPGSEGLVPDDETALEIARKVGYPVIIKASAGGGGRGIRVAHNDVALRAGMAQAKAEAEAAFGDGAIYMEKYLERPRHVEIQVLCDGKDGRIHLGERDCTIQRRHQKLLEESPSPVLDKHLRRAMGEAALNLCAACGYANAGTVEFLVQDGEFYFMEMNTRIQVEHPVTEMVVRSRGRPMDLIEEQIRVAQGEPLRHRQKDIRFEGHAIECRINAEDPDRDFAPFPGTVELYVPPAHSGVRVDSFVYSGYRIPPHYDSMLAKLIAHGRDRTEAIERARRALEDMLVEGVKTTIPFHRKLLEHVAFVNNQYDIHFIEEHGI